jgi:tRNA (guanine9-N1)-methyltransferase
MNNAAYKRWTGTEWWREGYEQIWLGKKGECGAGEVKEEDGSLQGSQHSIIYLTADSDFELMELKEGETYIIGGICDHNRYKVSQAPIEDEHFTDDTKNLCLNKATESNIRTGRLPIGRYLASLTTRKVLTVNQVFEILVKWVESRDWEKALYSVIPKRKFVDGSNKHKDDDGEEELDDGEKIQRMSSRGQEGEAILLKT